MCTRCPLCGVDADALAKLRPRVFDTPDRFYVMPCGTRVFVRDQAVYFVVTGKLVVQPDFKVKDGLLSSL